MNIQKIMKQAQEMQKKMGEAQEKIARSTFEGSSGGGLVKVTITGKGEISSIALDDSIIKAEEKEILTDLIIAAFNDAKRKADSESSSAMEQFTSGLSLPPGFKMPF